MEPIQLLNMLAERLKTYDRDIRFIDCGDYYNIHLKSEDNDFQTIFISIKDNVCEIYYNNVIISKGNISNRVEFNRVMLDIQEIVDNSIRREFYDLIGFNKQNILKQAAQEML